MTFLGDDAARVAGPGDTVPTSPAGVPSQRVASSVPVDPLFTVVVPIRNEVAGVREFVERLKACLKGLAATVLIVDDSTDDTFEVLQELAEDSIPTLSLVHRMPFRRHGGSAGAVTHGLSVVETPWAVVMSGGLRHPPEVVPPLLAVAASGESDVIVGVATYPDGEKPRVPMRPWLISRALRLSGAALFPGTLSGVKDPLSELFAVRLAALRRIDKPLSGIPPLLEILAANPDLSVGELPFLPGDRSESAGTASAGAGELMRQLVRLRRAVADARRP